MTRGLRVNLMPVAFAVLAAALFGVSTPFAKLLVSDISPIALAGLLYSGAFMGLGLFVIARRAARRSATSAGNPLRRNDLPWLAGAILSGGIVAPVALMSGLTLISGFSASLLLNLEGVATALIATMLFREALGRRVIVALLCMTSAGVLLSWDPSEGQWNIAGLLLLVVAGFGWGVDNNLTRSISDRDPVQIAMVKGGVAGGALLLFSMVIGASPPMGAQVIGSLVLGALSYGASLVFFVLALQSLGASRTGVFYCLGPFVGAVVSVVVLQELLGWTVFPALVLMIVGVLALVYERHSHDHVHEEMTHTHLHTHGDSAHDHPHAGVLQEPHNHEHTHKPGAHNHVHWPDIHHRHDHD